MQTRTLGDLLLLVKSLAGIAQFAEQEKDDIMNFVNRRMFAAYNKSPSWPRYFVPSEQRNVSEFVISGSDVSSDYAQPYYIYGEYTHTGTSTSNVYVPTNQAKATNQKTVLFYKDSSKKWNWATATYSKTLQDVVSITSPTNFAQQVDTDSTGTSIEYDTPADVKRWELSSSPVDLVLSKTQVIDYKESKTVYSSATARSLKEEIGEFIRIHRKQAFLNQSAIEYDFYVDINGAHIMNVISTEDTAAFITYQKSLAKLTDTYNESSTTEIPQEFFQYVAHAVYSDFLTMDGQTSKALTEIERAESFLFSELERIDIINNNNKPITRFSTHLNRQSR